MMLTAFNAAAAAPLPVHRHIGQWWQPPQRCPSGDFVDSPLAGNGDLGLTFCGPPSHTTFHLASNSFWNSNSHVDARPSLKEIGPPPYTQIPIGSLEMLVPELSDDSQVGYSA